MRIAIAGGSGTIGRPVAEALAARGHEVRVLSRRSPEHPVDLATGEGLDPALDGCEVLIDATNGGPKPAAARAVLIDGGRRLLEAAGRAGVSHHVCISIVGIEDVPLGYYRVKVEQEQLVESAAIPHTIVRATQFHQLIAGLFTSVARLRIMPLVAARLQPVDPAEVAQVIAGVAEGEPRVGRVSVAGPEVIGLLDLAREWKLAEGRRAPVVPIPLPGKLGRALRAGALTDPSPDHRGETTFAAWLGG